MPDMPRWASRLAAAVGVAVIAVLLARIATGDWYATGDQSIIALRALDVGGPDTPLLGPYSRFGWNHPGPALSFVLAPFAHLTRAHDAGLLTGTLAVNVAALVTIVWFGRRRDPLFVALAGLVTALLVRAAGTGGFVDPWNPYVIVLPSLAVAICAAATAAGDAWALVGTVAFASFVAQTHVGGAPLVVACTVVALGAVAWRVVRDPHADRRRTGRALVVAITVGAVAWLPALAEQFSADGPGNLTKLWRYFTEDHVVNGWAHGWDIVTAEYAVPGRWTTGHEAIFLGGQLDPGDGIPVALVLLAVATVVARRRHDREAFAVCTLALVVGAAVLVAASRVVEPAYPYLLRWTWVAGATAWLAITYTTVRALDARRRGVARAVTFGASAATVVIAVLLVGGAARTPFPVEEDERTVRAVLDPVMAELRDGPQPVRITAGLSMQAQAWTGGIRLRAERAGLDVRTEPGTAWIFGDRRVDGGGAQRELVVAAGREQLQSAADDPSLHLVARYDALTAAERAELGTLFGRADTIEKYRRFRAEDPDAHRRLVDLVERDHLIAVYVRDLTG